MRTVFEVSLAHADVDQQPTISEAIVHPQGLIARLVQEKPMPGRWSKNSTWRYQPPAQ
jgi:hypothetical protein